MPAITGFESRSSFLGSPENAPENCQPMAHFGVFPAILFGDIWRYNQGSWAWECRLALGWGGETPPRPFRFLKPVAEELHLISVEGWVHKSSEWKSFSGSPGARKRPAGGDPSTSQYGMAYHQSP